MTWKKLQTLGLYKIISQNKMFLLPTYPIFFQHVIGNRLFFLFGLTQADLKCTLCKNGDVGDEYHYLCVCSYFNAERTKFIGNGMIINSLTYKHLLNSRNASTLKQISKFIGIIFSKFVYNENIDRDVILLRQNVVTSSGRTVIRPTRLDL